MKRVVALMVAFGLLLSTRAADALKLVATVPLPGVTGRFDHFALDTEGRRLFVAALGNNSIEVIGLSKTNRITHIPGLQKPQGIVFLPHKNQIGVACGGDGAFKIFSGEDYKLIATISDLDDADNVRLEPKEGQTVFVGYSDGALAIIDPKTWKKSGDIKLPGHPESFQVASGDGSIFVNIPGVQNVAVLEPQTRRVRATFPITQFKSNFPMALDKSHNRAFIGCRTPPRLVVIDTEKGAQLADLEISADTDDLFFDAKRQCVYISCGEGFIDVINAAADQPLKPIQKIPTRAGARTSFFSRELDHFFLAVPNRGNDPAEIRTYAPPRP